MKFWTLFEHSNLFFKMWGNPGRSLQSKNIVMIDFTLWKWHNLHVSCFFEKHSFNLWITRRLRYWNKKLQLVRFWIKFLKTCRKLNKKTFVFKKSRYEHRYFEKVLFFCNFVACLERMIVTKKYNASEHEFKFLQGVNFFSVKFCSASELELKPFQHFRYWKKNWKVREFEENWIYKITFKICYSEKTTVFAFSPPFRKP